MQRAGTCFDIALPLHAEHLGEVALAGPIKSVQQFSDESIYLLIIRACHDAVVDVSGDQNSVTVLVFPAPHRPFVSGLLETLFF